MRLALHNRFLRTLDNITAFHNAHGAASVLCRTSPRNPRIPIYQFSLQTAFRARTCIFKSGISGAVLYSRMPLIQPHATHPGVIPFLDNLHFDDFVK
jgi:hypothetical protein